MSEKREPKKKIKKERKYEVTMFIRLIKREWGEYIRISIPADRAKGYPLRHWCRADHLRELLAGEREFVTVFLSPTRVTKKHALIFLEEGER